VHKAASFQDLKRTRWDEMDISVAGWSDLES
jgi:hypothetical protein